MIQLSVIIPIGPAEQGLGRLLGDLLQLPAHWEIVLVTCPDSDNRVDRGRIESVLTGYSVRWIRASAGRAVQMNAGARAARGDQLWFLHADSGFGPDLVRSLVNALRREPESLHYCRLAFMDDGAGAMTLNQWGANVRSGWLGVPFGDQGFCLSASLFHRLGGYPEDAVYGEDHLLVWRARRAGVPLHCCNRPLLTSARKYRVKGWGRLTLVYQWLWIRQALPQCWALLRGH